MDSTSHKVGVGVGVCAGEELELRHCLVDEHRDAVDCFRLFLFGIFQQ